MSDELKEQAQEAFEKVKEAGTSVAEKFKDSSAGKAILGEDGKFDKDDLTRIGNDLKESKVGKAILGEDGKFDKEDATRIVEDIKVGAQETFAKVKDIFNKD